MDMGLPKGRFMTTQNAILAVLIVLLAILLCSTIINAGLAYVLIEKANSVECHELEVQDHNPLVRTFVQICE